MTYALLSLLFIAVLFGALGWLSYSPLKILGGAIVLGASSVGVNYLIAYCFGIRSHWESAVISGLILTFLLLPPGSASDYVAFVIIAIISTASKYVLVWRGRHLMNPAAFGAAVATVTGFHAVGWWVAAPPLLVPVAIFGTFMLYRLGRLTMGYLYIVTAVIVTSIVAAMQGHFELSSLYTFVASYPILFLAYFMLSEPLTQAPRRLQRNLLAIGIALLASMQLRIGTIAMTPELALILGNTVAFFFGQRAGVRLRFVRREKLAGGQVAYYFLPLRRLHFVAGQYLELCLPHKKADSRGQRRMFTIASAPGAEQLRIVVREGSPLSSFKRELARLKKGAVLSATGIYGDFVLPQASEKQLLFVAGGIGITPFLAQLEVLRRTERHRDAVLLYYVNDKNDALMPDELRASEAVGVTVHIITHRMTIDDVYAHVKRIAERRCYVSGPPLMVDTAKAILKKAGARQIVTDQFDGY